VAIYPRAPNILLLTVVIVLCAWVCGLLVRQKKTGIGKTATNERPDLRSLCYGNLFGRPATMKSNQTAIRCDTGKRNYGRHTS